jgi:hypothetical protein
MKNVIAFCILFLLVVCCNPKDDALDMEGAYSLTSQVLNDGTKDSTLDRGQLKIYTDNYMMYASPNLTDSFANFGIGKYRVENGKVVEAVFYRAITGDSSETAILDIEKTNTGYRQVIDSILIEGKKFKLTEEYDEVSDTVQTPLDGAWKQVRNIRIDTTGDSTVNSNPLEYKIYNAGHFIWGITAPDSLNKMVSVYGYGTFAMGGANKTRETIKSSTFQTTQVGRTYEVDIEFLGNDSYKQTITFANGVKSVEIYERLK